MRIRVLFAPVAAAMLVLLLEVCVGRPVTQQVLPKPISAAVSTPAVFTNSSWVYRPTSRRLDYTVDQRALLTIREDSGTSADSISSHAEVDFTVPAQTSRVTGAVTAFTVQHSGRVDLVPPGLSLPFPFVAAYAERGRQLTFIAPSALPCLSPTVPVLQGLRDLWFQTPDTLRVGSSWKDSVFYTSCRDGLPLRSDVRRTFSVISVSEPAGRVLLVLRRQSQTSISGEGVLAGEPVRATGVGTGELAYTIDLFSGEVLSARGTSSLELVLHGKLRAQSVRQVGDIRIDRRT